MTATRVMDSEYQERAAKHKAAGSGDNAKQKHFNCEESIMQIFYAYGADGYYEVTAYSIESARTLTPEGYNAYIHYTEGYELLGKIKERTIIAIDIETDGLKWVGGQILEVCMHRLDAALNIVETYQGVLPFNIEDFSEFIMDMHTKNGLVNEAPTCDRLDIVAWLRQFENIVWLGSSVHFDAAWMREHFPEADVNHRVIDVSSLKGLVDLTNRLPKTESDHRAASDIAYSLDVARLYRDVLQAGVL